MHWSVSVGWLDVEQSHMELHLSLPSAQASPQEGDYHRSYVTGPGTSAEACSVCLALMRMLKPRKDVLLSTHSDHERYLA